MSELKKLLSYARGQYTIYFLSLLCTIISQIISTWQPQLIKIIIDTCLGGAALDSGFLSACVSVFGNNLHGLTGLVIMAGFIVFFSFIRGLFTFGRVNLASLATERSIELLRNRLYNHIQLLPYEFHTRAKTGDLIQRCTSDIETVRLALYSQIMDTISSFFLIIYTVYITAKSSIKLTVVSFSTTPFILIFSILFFKRIEKQFKRATKYEAEMTTAVQENLTGIRVVKAFTRHLFEIEKFKTRSETYRNQNIKINSSYAFFWALSDFLSTTQVFSVILYGSVLAYRAEISPGDLVAFISYTGMLIWPIRHLARIIGNIGKAFVSVNRIETILNEQTEELFPTGKKPAIRGNIIFDSVSFAYPAHKERTILHKVSFSIQAGKTLAILGPTGSGKSSLVHLLARLYEYNKGSVTIDGIELNTIDKGWIRSQIGLVLQEPFLYSKTIMENIKLAAPEASDMKARRFAEIASLDTEINNFEQGYNTVIGEKGVSLSGGQKQRLAIARTLIKNAPLLIFDDSLSAVDSETDAQIRKALQTEKGNKTIIIISHRIATVCDADKIIVLENGTVTQEGTHKTLIEQDGLYKRIYEIQSANKITE